MIRLLLPVFSVLVALAAMTPAMAQPLPLEQYLYRGRAIPMYGRANSEMAAKLLDAARQTRLAERMADLAERSLRLKTNLSVGVGSCGNANAFFDRQNRSIIFCLELIEMIATGARQDQAFAANLDRAAFGKLVDGAIWGIYLHELAHAVIHINEIPITGREEDVADQFMLYFAAKYLEPYQVSVIVPTLWFFKLLAANQSAAWASPDSARRLLADEHSLSEQRIFSVACWALGAPNLQGDAAARFVGLPTERAERCQQEYATLDHGMRARFNKYLKLGNR